jgi:hypothetical protein
MLDQFVPYKHRSVTGNYDVRATAVDRTPFACRGLRPPMATGEEFVEVGLEITGGEPTDFPMVSIFGAEDFSLKDADGHTYRDVTNKCEPYLRATMALGQAWRCRQGVSLLRGAPRDGDVADVYRQRTQEAEGRQVGHPVGPTSAGIARR